MKAISIDNRQVKVGNADYPVVTLYADSAIGRDVMPLFIPDIPVTWHSSVALAVRIDRLGKNISEKFAPRYVDAISIVNILYPDPASPIAESGAYTILDSAVTTGQWLPFDLSQSTDIEAQINGDAIHFDLAALGIAHKIALISRLATLKTGDIIILSESAIEVPLVTNTYIKASIEGTPCLSLKIK